jgi:uncharacterized membrane protein YfcA
VVCRKQVTKHTGTTVTGISLALTQARPIASCPKKPNCSLPRACSWYTSIGHAGASAYIALMALFGVAPAIMRPTALALNILVASFTSYRYLRAGMFRWRTLWPFLVGAIPLAFTGGAIQLPGAYYRPLVGVILLLGAARLLWPADLTTNREPCDPWRRMCGPPH